MIDLPKNVLNILNKLFAHGFEAYIVGGCVRDCIRDVIPYDWDITTSALPDNIIDIFNDYTLVKTGMKHGTVTVIIDKIPYEITTFRRDGVYSDNRHPDNVEFITDLYGDLERRDFTINAIAYNHERGLVDYFNGIEDIKNATIRCVGNPDIRFKEDALRIMRAIRFSAVLKYKIEDKTKRTMYSNIALLDNIAVERITVELDKMIKCDNYCDIFTEFKDILPPVKDIKYADDYVVRLAILFDIDTLKRLRYDNKTIKTVNLIQSSTGNEYKLLNKLGRETFNHWCSYNNIPFQNITPIILNINGRDLINIGFCKGSNISDTLDKLFDDVIAGNVQNEYNNLLEWSKRYMKTLYISDLDGTLLNSNVEMSRFTIDKLNEMIANGLNFAIATARTSITAIHLLRDLNLTFPVILMNGAAIYDFQKNEFVRTYPIKEKSCRFLFDTLERHGLYGFLYTTNDVYYINAESEIYNKFVTERRKRFGKIFTKVDSFVPHIKEKPIHFFLADKKDRLLPFYDEITADNDISIEFYQDIYNKDYWYLEVCDINASKYNGVKYLREKYNFDTVIGFGDNLNDISMFKACDYTCAVANAKPEVKSHADEIIDSNNDDGVVRFILQSTSSN